MDAMRKKVAAVLVALVMLPTGLAMSYSSWKSSQIDLSGIQWVETTLHYRQGRTSNVVFCASRPNGLASCVGLDMVRRHCEVLTQAWLAKTKAIPGLEVGLYGSSIVALRRDGEALCDVPGMQADRRRTAIWALVLTLGFTVAIAAFLWLPTGAERAGPLGRRD